MYANKFVFFYKFRLKNIKITSFMLLLNQILKILLNNDWRF